MASFTPKVERVNDLPADIEALCAQSEAEGFRFLRRLINDWQCGDNRFDHDGEAFYAVYQDGQLAAVGGLNCDCDDDNLGRIRRVYVHPDFRRHGVGTALMRRIEQDAMGRFRRLVLFTESWVAAGFYDGLQYRPIVGHPQRTHEKSLPATTPHQENP